MAGNASSVIGGSGYDVAAFYGNAADFAVLKQGDDLLVVHKAEDLSQAVTLSGVEALKFYDQQISLAAIGIGKVINGTVYNDTLTGTDFTDSIDGSAGNDRIYGLAGDDTLHGGDGNDTLSGAGGNDNLVGGNGSDSLSGGDGNDTLTGSTESAYYSSLEHDTLDGGAGDDAIFGWGAQDQIRGGDGNDYIGAGGASIDGGGGNDTITVHGNADGSQTDVSGGSGNDLIAGYDVAAIHVHGGDGDDTLYGYYSSDWLSGDDGNDAIYGGYGNDTLLGGAGADLMYGGAGDDYYYVDNAADVVSEQTWWGGDEGGYDRVASSISYTLGAYIEELDLIGTGNISGAGNELDNSIYGNSGNNLLSGNGGNDTLTGGAGMDSFVFSAAAANGVDSIQDFVHGTDQLWFTGSDYGFAIGHSLTASEFTAGTAAVGTSAQFIWDAANHTLYWDDDGTGSHAAIAIATFNGGATLSASDFHFS